MRAYHTNTIYIMLFHKCFQSTCLFLQAYVYKPLPGQKGLLRSYFSVTSVHGVYPAVFGKIKAHTVQHTGQDRPVIPVLNSPTLHGNHQQCRSV
jgi:hypothetical protein